MPCEAGAQVTRSFFFSREERVDFHALIPFTVKFIQGENGWPKHFFSLVLFFLFCW